MAQERRRMAGRSVGKRERYRIEDADERGDETVRVFGAQRFVGRGKHEVRIGVHLRDPANHVAHAAHDHRRL